MSTSTQMSPRRLKRHAQDLLREARVLLKKKRKKVSAQILDETRARVDALADALPRRGHRREFDASLVKERTSSLNAALTQHFAQWRKSALRELLEAVGWALGMALIIRFFLIEPFSIPSGSMLPTLEIGDHLFVSKLNYGIYWPASPRRAVKWHEPQPGEIIVFVFRKEGDPTDGEDYIKRVIGTPGDRVRLEDHVLHINGEPIQVKQLGETRCPTWSSHDGSVPDGPTGSFRCMRQEETLGDITYITQYSVEQRNPGGKHRGSGNWPHRVKPAYMVDYYGYQAMNPDWPDVVVPEGKLFVMGDNRDNSKDGRFWGFVDENDVKGSAFVIWWARDKSRLNSWLD